MDDHMAKHSYSRLLQIRSHLTNLIMTTGITDERLSQLHIVEKLIAEAEKKADRRQYSSG